MPWIDFLLLSAFTQINRALNNKLHVNAANRNIMQVMYLSTYIIVTRVTRKGGTKPRRAT